MKTPLLAALFLMSLMLFGACGKKDPDNLSSSQWVDRSLGCAEESIVTVIKKLEVKAKEAQSLSGKLQGILTAQGCPMGEHLECTPELGIQAIATYISTVTISSSLDTPKKGKAEPEDDEAAVAKALKEIDKTEGKHNLKDRFPGMPDTKVPPPIVAKKLDTSELGISPDKLAEKSRCGVKVTAKCTFATLDKVISQLTIFAKQAQTLEKEAARLLSLSSQDPYASSVQNLYLGMRSLEANIQELVTLEEAIARKKTQYLARYNGIKPLAIKGIIIDLSKVIPTVIGSRLTKYVPKLKQSLEAFKKRKKDYNEKLRAALRDLKRDQRQNGNMCLELKGCWKFRSCAKRFRLPGISLYHN